VQACHTFRRTGRWWDKPHGCLSQSLSFMRPSREKDRDSHVRHFPLRRYQDGQPSEMNQGSLVAPVEGKATMAVGKLVIREAEIFRGLDKETINYLAAGADAETYQQGDWIYQFEETGQALEIVHLGAVEAFLRPAAGEELAWGIVGPHECLPNSAVLPFTPWPSGARAIAPTT
jgi:hypothetical protein